MEAKLSLFSSIATLILFVFYFIGKTITILSVKRVWRDKVIIGVEDFSSFSIIDDVVLNMDYSTRYGILTSTEGIRNLKVFSVELDDDNIPSQKGEMVYKLPFLNIDQSIAFCVEPGELFPSLFIEYTTFDYMKVQLEWCDNLKSGVFGEFVQPRHTLKSFFYYLFR